MLRRTQTGQAGRWFLAGIFLSYALAITALFYFGYGHAAVTDRWQLTLMRGSTALEHVSAPTQAEVWERCQARVLELSETANPTTVFMCQTLRYYGTTVAAPRCQATPADRQIDCPTGYTGTWTQRATVGAYPGCEITWAPIAFPPDACTVVPQPPAERPLFIDRFEYDVSRSATNAEQLLAGSGWSAVKANNSNFGRGGGWVYTRADATLGSRVLVLESNPGATPIQGMPYSQTDYYLQLGREGSSTQVLPANVWLQFWTYATPDSRFSTRDKTIYPCSGHYACSWGPNLGWLFMWGSGGFNTAGDGSSRRYLAVEAQNADNRGDSEYPTNRSKLRQNVNATPLAGARWYQVRLHFDTSGAQGTYEAWVRERGASSWTKVSDWRGGQTANFFWPIPTDQRRGHTMFRWPTTVNGPGNSTVYVDDFVIARSQDALP